MNKVKGKRRRQLEIGNAKRKQKGYLVDPASIIC